MGGHCAKRTLALLRDMNEREDKDKMDKEFLDDKMDKEFLDDKKLSERVDGKTIMSSESLGCGIRLDFSDESSILIRTEFGKEHDLILKYSENIQETFKIR